MAADGHSNRVAVGVAGGSGTGRVGPAGSRGGNGLWHEAGEADQNVVGSDGAGGDMGLVTWWSGVQTTALLLRLRASSLARPAVCVSNEECMCWSALVNNYLLKAGLTPLSCSWMAFVAASRVSESMMW